MAPGHWFFCRRIAIPEDLETGEEEDYALLELENLSPFPLEHMFYGLRLDPTKRFAFVFAAYKRRFEKVDQTGWRRIDAVLPDFILGLNANVGAGDCLVLVTQKSLIGFHYDGLSSLPDSFYAEALEIDQEDTPARTLTAQVDSFAVELRKRFQADSFRIWYANTNAKWVGQIAWFGAVESDETPVAKVSFNRKEIWKADLRDPEMVEQARKDERQNGILWKGVIGLAACTLFLLLGEVYWGASTGYLSYRKNSVLEREDLVAEIRDLRSTSVTLRDFQESNLSPFRMIEALFPFLQYPKIIFRKFETEGPDVLVLDAKAANQSEVTEFKKRLERYEKISSVELSKQVNNTKGSTFTATIRFNPGAFYELAGVDL